MGFTYRLPWKTKTYESADENGDFRNGFKREAFWKSSVSYVDRWKQRLLKTVTGKTS